MNFNDTINKAVRNSLYNFALNTGQRIQQRRQRKGKKKLVKVNIANVPRRKGAIGQNGPRRIRPNLIKSSVMPNIGTAMKSLQLSGTMTLQGTEHMCVLGTGAQDTPPNFKVLQSIVLNPAEPGLAPMLAASANQYQRFKTLSCRLTYTPTASAATNGTVYFAVFPDPDTPDPTTVQQMSASGNMQSYPAYGGAVSWQIPMNSLQQAFKVQTVDVPAAVGGEDNLNVSGKLIIAEVGVPVNTTIGQVLWTYAYAMSLAKVTQGANSVHGSYSIGATAAEQPLVFDSGDLVAGWETLVPTDTPGVYKPRIQAAPHILVVRTVGLATAYEQEVDVSQDQSTWTAVTPIFTKVISSNTNVSIYKLDPTPYVRIQSDAAATLTSAYVFCASLRL